MTEYDLTKEELEILYDVFFRRMMAIMKEPEVDIDPFAEVIKHLSRLSGIFSFKSMVSLIPEMIAYAIRYGMLVEKTYQEERYDIAEEHQEVDPEEEQEKRMLKIKEDMDKFSLYL